MDVDFSPRGVMVSDMACQDRKGEHRGGREVRVSKGGFVLEDANGGFTKALLGYFFGLE